MGIACMFQKLVLFSAQKFLKERQNQLLLKHTCQEKVLENQHYCIMHHAQLQFKQQKTVLYGNLTEIHSTTSLKMQHSKFLSFLIIYNSYVGESAKNMMNFFKVFQSYNLWTPTNDQSWVMQLKKKTLRRVISLLNKVLQVTNFS